MSGVKGRSGVGSGGVRANSGRKRRRLYFAPEQSELIGRVVGYHRSLHPELSPEDIAYTLFEREYEAIKERVTEQQAIDGMVRAEQEVLGAGKEP